MVRTAAQKIADVLIFLCGFLIFCDILLLPLTPALAYFRFQNPASMRFDHLLAVFAYDFDDGVGNLLEIILKEAWKSPETDRRRRPGADRLHPLPGWRRRIAVLHRFVHPPLHHGGPSVPGDGRAVSPGSGDEGGKRPDDLR